MMDIISCIITLIAAAIIVWGFIAIVSDVYSALQAIPKIHNELIEIHRLLKK